MSTPRKINLNCISLNEPKLILNTTDTEITRNEIKQYLNTYGTIRNIETYKYYDDQTLTLGAIIYFKKWHDDHYVRQSRINFLSGDTEHIIHNHKHNKQLQISAYKNDETKPWPGLPQLIRQYGEDDEEIEIKSPFLTCSKDEIFDMHHR